MENTQIELNGPKTQILDQEILKYFEGDYLFKLKEKPEQKILDKLHANELFWELLLQNLRFSDMKILEHMYLPEIKYVAFIELEKKMKFFQIKRTALRNKVDKFDKLGLIVCMNSGLLFVNGEFKLQRNMINLIKLCKAKFGMQLL